VYNHAKKSVDISADPRPTHIGLCRSDNKWLRAAFVCIYTIQYIETGVCVCVCERERERELKMSYTQWHESAQCECHVVHWIITPGSECQSCCHDSPPPTTGATDSLLIILTQTGNTSVVHCVNDCHTIWHYRHVQFWQAHITVHCTKKQSLLTPLFYSINWTGQNCVV